MIKRKLYKQLKDHLSAKEISFIVGPRQAGKTTLMNLLQAELLSSGEKTLYLTMDIEKHRQFFASQAQLVDKIRLEIGTGKGYIFLDEVQRKDSVGLFLKGIYDMDLPYKFIVSGSGSVDLKAKVQESLTGRKRMFELSTVSFEEFVNFKTDYRYEEKLPDFFKIEQEYTQRLFEEYMQFGGYPRIVLEETAAEKMKLMQEIYEGYIEKDIGYLLGVENIEAFSNLVRLMAAQIGNLINISELSSTLGISVVTVKNYLWYLENTYIIQKVTPFFQNTRKEITKSPCVYFVDLGFCNYTQGKFGQNLTQVSGSGFLFENFVFNLLRENQNLPSRIHFWRTKDKAEVDFVIVRGMDTIPVEVKYTNLSGLTTGRSYRNFIARYKPQVGYIVHLGGEKKVQINTTAVHFVPYYHWIGQKPI